MKMMYITDHMVKYFVSIALIVTTFIAMIVAKYFQIMMVMRVLMVICTVLIALVIDSLNVKTVVAHSTLMKYVIVKRTEITIVPTAMQNFIQKKMKKNLMKNKKETY
jgi:uncharacterized membrane protein